MNRIFYTLFAIAALFTSLGCEQHPKSELPPHYQKDHGHGDSHGDKDAKAHAETHAKTDSHAAEEKKAH